MTAVFPCPCNSALTYQACCGRYHSGAVAECAQTLMRARYSAYVRQCVDFIRDTSLPAQQTQLDVAAISQWSQDSHWLDLEILNTHLAADQRHAHVEFIAHWRDAQGEHQHHEHSLFIKVAQQWYFYDPNVPLRAERNSPCPCASGLKFKKCCAAYL